MKATIEIGDALFQAAKRMAAERNTTLEAVVEAALRSYLDASAWQAQATPRLRRHSFRGRGLQPGLSESGFATIRARAYQSRCG